MLPWLILYFLLTVSVLALCFLPAVRQRALGWVALTWGRSRGRWVRARQQGIGQAAQVHDSLRFHAGAAHHALWRHRRWVAAGLALLLAMPMLAWVLSARLDVSGYDHTQVRVADERIAALLAGEQLVPPPPLPPEMFTTQEVEQVRPLIRHASREWHLLDDDFRQRLLVVFKIMKDEHGYDMVLLEGYRSPERQARLAALGGHVTRAGAHMSYHQYGLAADCAFQRDGRIVISERDPWAMRGYELYGEVARSVGLVWGGGWRSIKDYGHVELRRPGVLGKPAAPIGDNAPPPPAEYSGDFTGSHP